ncbi:sporulation-delaying protein SdpB family protein [Leifsonia sp. NPDC102414]|uniref:sporulation-delaying protein SdpB family protein n=1 Tax=Leifsonia sp. NPDC102414 TaxID=3364124 RepID=UPI00381E65E9
MGQHRTGETGCVGDFRGRRVLRGADRGVARALTRDVWTANLGLARTLIALSGLGTLLASSVSTLIRPAAGVNELFCAGPAAISSWCITPPAAYELMRWVSILVLLVAALGWRPRYTAIPMWWVLFSNQASLTVVDGGDQISAVLALLLVPMSLTDNRRWHWASAESAYLDSRPYATITAHVTLVVIRVQVAYIYINACLAKLGVPEWLDGSAVYYWLRDPMFGPAGALRPLTEWLMAKPVPVAAATWGTLLLEFALGIAIFLPTRARRILLPIGVALHLGIAITMGLWSFAFTMWAALLLLLWPDGNFAQMGSRWLQRIAARRHTASAAEDTRSPI